MIEHCTLYFPIEKLPLKSVFPNGKSDGGIFKRATWYEYESGDGRVRLELRHPNLPEHLRGFRAYVAQLPNSGAARAKAQAMIRKTKAAVGVILPGPVAPDSQQFGSLVHLIHRFRGFMFVADSIMLPDGRFLVGPMAEEGEPAGDAKESALREVNPDDLKHGGTTEGVDPARVAMRERHYYMLAERGFRCSRWLPLYRSEDGEDSLRPVDEIAARLMALNALFLWVTAPEDVVPTERIHDYVGRNALEEHLTDEENEIRLLPRADAQEQHANTIGWSLENMWALAWILGFEPAPPFYKGQLSDEVTRRMIMEFLPNLDATVAGFVAEATPRTAAEVAQLEDLYYCTHNAVRSAQTGEETVPQCFHPVRDGGAIHERRYSLTWAMSSGTDWDDTDLST